MRKKVLFKLLIIPLFMGFVLFAWSGQTNRTLNFSAEIPVCKNGDECEKLTPLPCFAKQNMGGNKIGTTAVKPWGSIPFGIDDALIGKPAPQLDIVEWLNGEGITLNDVHGKVAVLEFFQLWCPGCNKFSIPLMKEWTEQFAGEEDILFVSIHTVFEGHQFQSPKRLKKFVKKKKIQHLVGIDRHADNDPVPITMRRYRTGGTPCMVIVDKQGLIRFKYMGGFRAEPVTAFIKDLLNEHVLIPKEKSGPC